MELRWIKGVLEGKRTAKEALMTPTAVEVIPESLGPVNQIHQVESLSRVVLEDFFRKELKLAANHLLNFKFALDFSPLSSGLVMIMVSSNTVFCGFNKDMISRFIRH